MLYFVRHGQTNHNLNKLLAGRCDIELNEEGLKQAKETALDNKSLNIDLIYCSPLIRAKQTCNEINKYHNKKVILKEELIERNFGKYESCSYSTIDGEKCWNYYDETYNNDIEPLNEVFKRVHYFLESIKEEIKSKNILIVAHNDIGRAIYCYFNGLPSNGDVRNINMNNAKIVRYEWRNVNDEKGLENN